MAARLRYLLAVVVVMAVTLPATPASAQPKRGGTLTYTYHPEPTALSTIATTAVPVSLIATKIYESLLEYEGPGMTPRPGLAESWTVSSDRLTYTFTLRKGVKWHDGKPFSSEDVKFSIENIVKPYHARGRVYFGNLESVSAPDPRTVVFRLKAPVPYFLKAFQPTEAPILPKHLLATTDLATIRQSRLMHEPVGTGPFRLKEWSRGSHIILERNPDYWKPGRPYLDRVVLRVIPDGAARAIALEKGELDLAPMTALPPAEIKRVGTLPHVVTSTEGSEGLGPIMWLEVNLRDKPLSDVRVRQAISLALDRQKLVDVIWFGLGKPATGPVVSGNPVHYDRRLRPFEYNLEKANKLLDEAGYPKGPRGVRFKLTQTFLPYGEAWVRMAEFTKHELGKIGIEIDTQSFDLSGWLKKIYTDWDYHITSNFIHNYPDPSIGIQRAFVSSNILKGATFTNSMAYVNRRIDDIFAKAAALEDGPARNELFFEAQQLLREELPVIFLMEMAYTHVWNKRVHGLITNGISMYSNWDSVWVE